MRLVSFEGGFGRVEDDAVVPMGPSLVDWLAFGTQGVATGKPRPLAETRLLAPVPRPGKVICVGLSYRDHARGDPPGAPQGAGPVSQVPQLGRRSRRRRGRAPGGEDRL